MLASKTYAISTNAMPLIMTGDQHYSIELIKKN